MKKVLLLLLFSHAVMAQSTYHFDLLKDINSKTYDADIRCVKTVGNSSVIFQIDKDLNTNTYRLKLWSYDGTIVKHFASSSLFGQNSNFSSITVIDDYIFFYVDEISATSSFYVVKLNTPHINKIADLVYNPIHNPTVIRLNTKFYYNTNTPESDGRLYYYNEITNQSTEVQGADLNFYNPKGLTMVNNLLYFAATTGADPNKRQQLWVSDGTNAGTRIVKELAPGGMMLGHMSRAGNNLIFDAVENDIHSIYVSDGTTAGTHPFKDFQSFATVPNTSPIIYKIYNFGNMAVLLIYNDYCDQLWVTNGTDSRTKLISMYDSIGFLENKEIAVKDGWMFYTTWNGLLLKTDGKSYTILRTEGIPFMGRNNFKMIPNPVDDKLYFSMGDFFYKTDATIEGTELISDKAESPQEIWVKNPFALVSNKLIAYTRPKRYADFGTKLYEIRSDTIRLLKDLDSASYSSQPKFLLNTQGKSYFSAYDGNFNGEYYSPKVFETDGTLEGTKSVDVGLLNSYYHFLSLNKEIFLIRDNQLQKINFSANSYENIFTLPKSPIDIAPIQLNTKAYFILGETYDYFHRELWVTNGTNTGTSRIKIYSESDHFDQFAVYNQQLYVFTKAENTLKIWKFVNDNSPPLLIKTITGRRIYKIHSNFRNKLAFLIEATDSMELWVTDGTENGTSHLNSFPIRYNEGIINFYFTDNFYYYLDNVAFRNKIWKSGGLPANTTLIADVPGSYNPVTQFCLCNNTIFFNLTRPENTQVSYLYKHDLSTSTTTLLNEIGYLSFGNKKHFTCLNKQLYIPAIGTTIDSPRALLYTSDGTPEGTKDILSLENGPDYKGSENTNALYPLNDQEALINVKDKLYGEELFVFRRCDNPTNLSGTTADSKIQSSSTFLESTEKLDGNSRVYYFAPKSITLNPGFSVDNTNVFKAEIKNRPCTLRQ